jgi:hypothetical protein
VADTGLSATIGSLAHALTETKRSDFTDEIVWAILAEPTRCPKCDERLTRLLLIPGDPHVHCVACVAPLGVLHDVDATPEETA